MRSGQDKQKLGWKADSHLVPSLSESSFRILDALPRALAQVWPLSAAHRRSLPSDIRELSLLLTSQRSGLRRNYWSRPAFISAYLYYFLPWNLVRLCRLFSALKIRQPDGQPLLADVGAGPLSATMALWIARPDLRKLPITVFALDSARHPLELGGKLFAALAQILKEPCWETRIATGPVEALPKLAPDVSQTGLKLTPWLCLAANVLNEMKPARAEKAGESPNYGRLEMLLCAWRPFWQKGGQLLFVEPGTRLGGAIIMALRESALDLGLVPHAPCTHAEACPLNEEGRGGLPSSWCHFVFSGQEAPEWLKALSRKAGLAKTSLTLSPLFLSTDPVNHPGQAMPVRVVSQSFPVADGMARYGCSSAGLTLLPDSRAMLSGAFCLANRPAGEKRRDARSGAIVISPWREGQPGKRI